MKVLVINCGSSSLKYQLIDMDGEKVLCKGLCERIGMESSMITHEANGHKATTPAIFPTHTEAFAEVVKKMTTGEGKCIDDVSEITAIGHRVVHGGEKFKASCLITDEVINTIRELSPLAGGHALRQGAVGDVALPHQRKRGSAAAQDQPLAAGVRLPYPGADRVGPAAQIARAAPGIVLGGKGVLQPTDIALVLQNRLFLQRVQLFPERPACGVNADTKRQCCCILFLRRCKPGGTTEA